MQVGLQTAEHVVQLVDLRWGTTGNAALPLSHDLKHSIRINVLKERRLDTEL